MATGINAAAFVGRNAKILADGVDANQKPWDQDAEVLFRSIDINSDGSLQKEELMRHVLEMGLGKREAAKLFDMLDTGGDGQVSMDEWKAKYERFQEIMEEEHTAAVSLQALQRGVRGRQIAQARSAYMDFKTSSGMRAKSATVEQLLMNEPRWKTKTDDRFANLPWYQWRLLGIIEHDHARILIMFLIILNGVIIGIQADDTTTDQVVWDVFEAFFVIVFTAECIIKNLAMGSHFWGDGWNIFDFVIVFLSLVDVVLQSVIGSSEGSGPILVMRLMRTLRMLRLISFSERLNLLVTAWLLALNAVFWVGILLVLLIYMFAVLGHGFIGTSGTLLSDPKSREGAKNFESLPLASATLLQFMTGDNWMEASREVGEKQPWVWFFILFWLVVAWIGLLNLLTAIFIDSLTELSKEADSAKKLVIQDKRYALMKFIAESYCRFDVDNDGALDIAEVDKLMKAIEKSMSKELNYLGIDLDGVQQAPPQRCPVLYIRAMYRMRDQVPQACAEPAAVCLARCFSQPTLTMTLR